MVIVTSDSGFGPAEWATIAAALIAAVVAVTGYALTQAWARRERRAKAFADALAAVEDYLEAPYRLRRRQASAPEVRAELCSALSDLQARIALHSAWLQVQAPAVAEAYEALVSAARAEAGTQMTDAWNAAPLASDADMNLKVAYLHPGSDVQRLTRSRGDARGISGYGPGGSNSPPGRPAHSPSNVVEQITTACAIGDRPGAGPFVAGGSKHVTTGVRAGMPRSRAAAAGSARHPDRPDPRRR